MKRDLEVTRVYKLGDYKSIHLGDVIKDIPQEVLLDTEIIGQLRYLQFVTMELQFRKYLQLNTLIPDNLEDAISYLDQVRLSTFEDLKKLLNGNLKGE